MSAGSYSLSLAAIRAQMNAAFDVPKLIEFLGWHSDKLVKSGDVYLAFCPIHRDEMFRTLVLNPRNNTYHCQWTECPGNQPADLIDLIAKSRAVPSVRAMVLALDHFGPSYFRLNEKQQLTLRQVDLAT